MKSDRSSTLLAYICLIVLAVLVLFPFAWMLATSVKTQPDVYKSPPVWIPKKLTLANYQGILTPKWGIYTLNSLLVCSVTTVIVVAVGSVAAYGFSRFRFRMRDTLLSVSLVGRLLPVSVMFVPFYMMFAKIGLSDTLWTLVVVYVITNLPFGIWILTEYINSIPRSLDEAAIIDGSSFLQVMIRVVFPVASPGIVTVAFLSFISSWQEFLFANLFLTTVSRRTLPLGLMGYQGQYFIDWGGLMAAAVATALPMTLVFVIFQRKIVPGLTGGALKG